MMARAKKWLVYTAVVVIGLTIALAVSLNVHFQERHDGEKNFKHLAEMKNSLIETELLRHRDYLRRIGSFMNSLEQATTSQFIHFAMQEKVEGQTLHVLGWLDYIPETASFSWRHLIYADGESRVINQDISPNPDFLRIVQDTAKRADLSYHFVPAGSSIFNEIYRNQRVSSDNHLLLLHPVYKISEHAAAQKEMIGMAFSIIDFERLLHQISEDISYGDASLVDVSAESVDILGNKKSIYKDNLMGASDPAPMPYEVVKETSLGNTPLTWRFTPSQQFMDMHEEGHSYIIFLALAALTIAVLILCQMWLAMVIMRSSKQKAEELSRLKSDFLATMSHEIRTPMNGILGMAELILSNRPPKQIENYARTILNSGETLLDIINDILDFSKIEAGKMQIDPTGIDMLELVDDLAALYSVKARDKALEIAVRYVPGSERFVYADPLRIRQVLGNLISNAIKFTDKGHISITVEEVRQADAAPENVVLKFSIKDTGIGISAEMQQKIFEKFLQGDSSTTRKYGGTGLGLNISKSLVSLMAGRIGIESKQGEGATFWFEIPLKRNLEKAPLKLESAILRDVAILIVDDLSVIRQILCEQLTDAGLRPGAADGGEEALRMMRERAADNDPYQIVIIDYLMPGMNGEGLAAAIRQDELLKNTCMVMLTAAGNPMADSDFARKGFSAYISKPVQIRALVEALGIVWSHFRSRKEGDETLIRLDSHNVRETPEEDLNELYNLQGKMVLLAEDNLVNQIFIKEILESMKCGYTVVTNGQEAVNEAKSTPYDLILMDCLMPVMDGYEATRTLRKMESEGVIGHKLNIIALTANAMKGDRERCVEAGMDDYVSKPVRKKLLQNILVKWLKDIDVAAGQGVIDTAAAEQVETERDTAAILPFDKADVEILDLDAVENARSVLKADYAAMVHIFVQNCYERYEEMEGARKARDIEGMIRPSHTLKSTSLQMGALQMAETCRRIEYTAKQIHAAQTEPTHDELASIEAEIGVLIKQIEDARSALEKIAA